MTQKTYEFDCIFSLAGEDKSTGNKLKQILDGNGITSWIYTERESELAGSDQPSYLEGLFSKRSKYCIILISKDYIQKKWTGLERQYIIDRWLKDKSYLIPVQLDDSKLEGVPGTTGYISAKGRKLEEIAQVIAQKVGGEAEETNLATSSGNLYRMPRLNQNFNPMEVRNEWVFSIIEEIKTRSSQIEGLELYHDEIEGVMHLSLRYKGDVIYSLNIFKKAQTPGDDGISFYGAAGEIRGGGGGAVNAFGSFEWSKEREEVIIKLLDMSLLETLQSHESYFTKKEFIDKLWDKICDILEQEY